MEAEIRIPDWATHVVSDHTDMDRDPHPVDSGKVSSFRLRLPDDVYFEYAFLDGEGRMRADPENELRAENPWYPEASAIVGPDYRAEPHADLGAELERGKVDRHRLDSERLGSARRVSVYTPQRCEGAELPLVLVQDGIAFLRLAGLPRVLEAVVAEGKARPARLAFIEPVDRIQEYGFDVGYRRFVMEELLPFLAEQYPSTGERVAWGASLGGLVSVTLALENPGSFAAVATFSGALLGTPAARDFYRSRDSWVLERLQEGSCPDFRWYLEVGRLEWLTDINRRVRDLLDERGCAHAYDERNAGHNWTNWRNGLAAALSFVLGPDSPAA